MQYSARRFAVKFFWRDPACKQDNSIILKRLLRNSFAIINTKKTYSNIDIKIISIYNYKIHWGVLQLFRPEIFCPTRGGPHMKKSAIILIAGFSVFLMSAQAQAHPHPAGPGLIVSSSSGAFDIIIETPSHTHVYPAPVHYRGGYGFKRHHRGYRPYGGYYYGGFGRPYYRGYSRGFYGYYGKHRHGIRHHHHHRPHLHRHFGHRSGHKHFRRGFGHKRHFGHHRGHHIRGRFGHRH